MGPLTPSTALYSGKWKLFLVSASGNPLAQHTQRAGLCSQQNRPAPPYATVSPACLPFRSLWSSASRSSLDPRKDRQLTGLFLCLQGGCTVVYGPLVGENCAECWSGRQTEAGRGAGEVKVGEWRFDPSFAFCSFSSLRTTPPIPAVPPAGSQVPGPGPIHNFGWSEVLSQGELTKIRPVMTSLVIRRLRIHLVV